MALLGALDGASDGATSLQGEMIDEASRKVAERVARTAEGRGEADPLGAAMTIGPAAGLHRDRNKSRRDDRRAT